MLLEIVFGVLWLFVVVVVGMGLWALIRKGARGVPTAGNIVRAQLREQDKRDALDAQNAAADDIIRTYRERGGRIPPATLPVRLTGYTTDEVEEFYRNQR